MPKILVYLWFDVEDYITREADDPPKKVIDILSQTGVKATVKIVGEKLRSLKEHGREDVIAAISSMDVGYHLDTHSQHPTLYEYLVDKDVKAGAAEFLQRERNGYGFVKSVFDRELSCFGHPGPTWAPHVYPALQDLGIPVYLDETSILNLNDSPYWYCNVLNLNGAGRNFINLDRFFERPDGLDRTKKRFSEIHKRLRATGGTVSILFHLHTIVNRKFWDEVNFARGLNPSREEFARPPPQSAEVTQRAYRDFEKFIKYLKSFGDVEFITASDAASIFRDSPMQTRVDLETLKKLLNSTRREIRCRKVNEAYLSPAQIFHLATKAAAEYAESASFPADYVLRQPLGPLSKRSTSGSRTLTAHSLLDASKKALEITENEGYIPSEIIVEKTTLSPEDYLVTVCSLLLQIIEERRTPERLRVKRGYMVQAMHIKARAFREACKWPVLPLSFSGPMILEQAFLQTWTLKPAIPSAY
jgi:hypothetical protein